MLKPLQKAGQWAFRRADALFNPVFGEHLNPLYYLGAIAYWMLWIVVVTGLYLYVFFRTGVEEAYSSVEYLTVQQWWLGGVCAACTAMRPTPWCWRWLRTSSGISCSTVTAASAGSRGSPA